jgi:dolichyl-phosphate beta-glucosyltransferase
MHPDLSLVVPAFNEEGRLPAVLDRLEAFAQETGLALEIVLADDGSSDRSSEVFQEWSDTPRSAAVVTRAVKIAHRGKGAAVRAGMALVTAPIVGYCDADLSAGPDAIVQLLASIRQGADVSIASRGLPGSILEIHQPWYRELAGRTLNLGLRALTRMPFKDTQCGLKLFRAAPAREIFVRQRVDGFAFDIEIILIAGRLGYRVEEIPIRWAHATGSKVSLARDSMRMARDTLRVVRRLNAGHLQPPGVPGPEAMHTMTGVEDTHWWHVAKRRLVLDRLLAASPVRRCLDVGCGGGAMLAEAAALGPVVGTDLSADALHAARARGVTALVRSDVTTIPMVDESFSAVLALDVIEHHARPEVLLGEIRRVLVADGSLIVTVPAFESLWSYADDVLGHYRRYTRAQLAADLSGAGFVVQDVRYFHSWLLPVAWGFRRLNRLLGRTGAADDFPLPGPINLFFLGLSSFERRFLGRVRLPFGVSIMAVARKPR